MSNLQRIVLGFVICFGLTIPALAFQNGNELFNVPVARMEPRGFLEVGGGVVGSYKNSSGTKTDGSVFVRASLSDYFEYSLSSRETSLFHSLELGFEPIGSVKQSGHLAIGVKNIGWQRPTSPSKNPVSTVFGSYLVTSFQFREQGAWIHAGVAESRFKNVAIGFAGVEIETPIGRLSAEWDSEVYFFGIKTVYGGICQVSLGGTVRSTLVSDQTENLEQFQIGISFIDPPVTSYVKEPAVLVKKAVSENAKVSSDIKSSLNVQAKIATSSVPTPTVKAKRSTADEHLEASLKLMEKGNYYYYQGQFEEALTEYLKFIKLNPNLASGYTAVGSIYMQLGLKADAMLYWKKALALDPTNIQIKSYLNTQKKGSSIKLVDPQSLSL